MVAEQLGVERTDAHASIALLEAGAHAAHEVACVLVRERRGAGAVVRLLVVAQDAVVMGREAVKVAIRAAGGVAPIAPYERNRLAIDRPQDRTFLGRQRPQMADVAESENVR